MKRFALYVLSVFIAFAMPLCAKVKTVEADYLYQIPDNVTNEQAKATALERAKIQCIADEFGTLITQSNTTNVSINNGEVSSNFMSLGGSELKGEWIETIGEPSFEFITDGGSVAIKVHVKGRIRELTKQRIPYKVSIFRNGIESANESIDFMKGDALYMSFQAAAKGFLAIYLLDANNNAFCLLPYQGQTNGFFDVKSNQKYILFNKSYAHDIKSELVDELLLDTDLNREQNRILTIFSPNKFYKAVDSKSQEDLPRDLSSEDFEEWLTGVIKKDPDLSISETLITISK